MDINRIKRIMDSCIERHEENCAAAVVTRNGKEELAYSCGKADIEKGIMMQPDTICRGFSISKISTSVACMMLIERGLLDFDINLEWIIPEFANPVYIKDGKAIQSRSIKIRDLLNMTSGIPYPGYENEGIDKTNELWGKLDESIRGGHSMTTLEFASAAGKCPLMFDAGDTWMYGASADILGAVIERVSGQRLSSFMEENIFSPLGMTDTAFYVPKAKEDRLAAIYINSGDKPQLYTDHNLCIYDVNEVPAFESGGAGLFTTARDYAKLGAMLSCMGEYNGKRILGSRTVEFMSSNGLTDKQKQTYNWDSVKGHGYANFLRVIEDRNAAGTLANKGAFGWDGWTGTYLLCDAKEKMSVTLFLQRCGASTTQLARNLVNAVYSMLD